MVGKAVRRVGVVALLALLALSALVWDGAALVKKPAPAGVVSARTLSVSGTFSTGFQVQNLDASNTATIQITYYSTDGSTAATQTDTISAGISKTYFGSTMQAPTNFKGSAVVQSDRQIAVVVNELVSDPSMLSSYVGVNTPATTVNIPLVLKGRGGYDTKIYIQNAGSATASNVQVKFYAAGTNTVLDTKTSTSLAVGGVFEVDQSTQTGLPSNYASSALVTSDQPVAVVVNQSNSKTLLTYTGFSVGASKLYAPLVMTANFGYFAGLQAMNTGATTTTATLNVYNQAGTAVLTDTVTLAAGASKTWYPVTTDASTRFVGSATVEAGAGGTLAGLVNQINSAQNQGTSYGLFSATSATNKVVAPLIQTANPTTQGYFSGYQVQNIGSADASVTITRQASTGTSCSTDPRISDTVTIKPNSSYTWYPASERNTKCVGSATVTGPSGSQLVGVVNQLNTFQGAVDLFSTYEGINQ